MSSQHKDVEAPSLAVSQLAQHPDPAPSSLVRAAQARLQARLDEWQHHEEPPPAGEAEERYVFGEVFAVGGLGVIRRAFDRRLGRTVAVKTLQRSDPAATRRFALEARITARLQHPGIVPLHDMGRTARGEPYYCMKLIEGRSLDRVIAAEPTLRGRLRLLESVLAAADAIAHAHQHGVLHRDIKPGNILVGAHGETVVIDWGLAKDLTGDVSEESAGGELTDGAPEVSLTAAGAIVGTLRYMPPEQARAGEVDARSDVFALGAVLFHVLAGRPPHARLEREELLERLLAGEIEQLQPLVPDAPRELVAIAQKAMSPRPDDRYPGAAEFAEDLRRFSTGRLVDAHRYQPGELLRIWIRRHRASVAAAGAALLALGVASIVYLQRVRAEQVATELARARAEAAETDARARANAALLAQARGVLETDPAEALRLLVEVELTDPLDVRRARLIAQAAIGRGAPDRTLRGHTLPIEAVAPLVDGGLLSIDAGGAVRRWNGETGRGQQVIDLQAPLGTVVAAADAPVWAAIAETRVVIDRGDPTLESFELSAPLHSWLGTHTWQLSRGGETLAALGTFVNTSQYALQAAYAWDLRARPARAISVPIAHKGEAALSHDGQTIAVIDPQRRTVLVRDGVQTVVPSLGRPVGFTASGSNLLAINSRLSLSDGAILPLDGAPLLSTFDDQALMLQKISERPPEMSEPQLVLVDLATGARRWTVHLRGSNEERHAFHGRDGGFVGSRRGDRFAIRFDGRWTLWSTASGKIARVLEVGGRGRGAFLRDGGFVATHGRDLWLWRPGPSLPAPRDRWLASAPDDSHALVHPLDRRGERAILRTRDDARTRIACPLQLDWRDYSLTPRRFAVDTHGRALVVGVQRDACLIDSDGAARVIDLGGRAVAAALSPSGAYALGLADGSVRMFFTDRKPATWQLGAPAEALWLANDGTSLFAYTGARELLAAHIDDDSPVLLGRLGPGSELRRPAVALEPDGSGAALALPGASELVFYDDGIAVHRPISLPTASSLAFSPSGRSLAIATPGPAVRIVAGPDDPGREITVPTAVQELAFVDEETLAIAGSEDTLVRVDAVLGEAIVIQRGHAMRPLGLALPASRRGDGQDRVERRGGPLSEVPGDRELLRAWLAARTN